MVTKSTRKPPPPNPYLTAPTPDELGAANRIAYDLVADRRDLLPSVERIKKPVSTRTAPSVRSPSSVPRSASLEIRTGIHA
jgi:hypothetical protein